MTTYRRFQTPFYKIEVGDASGKNMLPLPLPLAKLVDKVEIVETMSSSTCSYNQITITMFEGSREPFSRAAKNTGAIYKLGTNDTDTLSNRTGLIPDLIFTKGSAGTGISTQLPSASGTINDIAAAAGVTASVSPLTGTTTLNIIEALDVDKKTNFVFKERNQIKVTWGYLNKEGKAVTQRSARGRIQMIQTDFPENDHPKTTVTCFGPEHIADQKTTVKGVKFSNQQTLIDPKTGKTLVTYTDMTTADIIKKLCSTNGMKFIISEKLIASVLDKERAKVWPAGMSFHQFLVNLARRHSAYYTMVIDPDTGDDTIIFVSKKDIDSVPVLDDPQLFTYKGSNAALKSVNIRVDFGGLSGHMESGYGDNGDFTNAGHDTGGDTQVMFTNAAQVNTNANVDNTAQVGDAVNSLAFGGKTTGKYNTSAEGNSSGNVSDKSKARSNCYANHLVILEFNSLGVPEVFPGPLAIRGIGNRYSGVYYILTVTHTLDENGYTTRGQGQGNALYDGGLIVPAAPKGQEATDPQVEVQLTTALPSLSSISDAASPTSSDTANQYKALKKGK